MTAPEIRIVYRLYPMREPPIEVALSFSEAEFRLTPAPDAPPPPDWAALSAAPCANCALPPGTTHCPYALAAARVLDAFGPRWSTERLHVEVETDHRRISATTDMQSALRSLLGLVGPASGCPALAFLRPMARMHAPFADVEETAYRAISMQLMRAWLTGGADQPIAVTLQDLRARYAALEQINERMAARLRQAGPGDAAVNAIAALDALAVGVDDLIETGIGVWADRFLQVEPDA